MKIIPAIDIINGQCVRLTQGNYDQKTIYEEDPLIVAKNFERIGLSNIHLVDLDGSKSGKVTNWQVIQRLAQHTSLRIDFGGGIKTDTEIERLLSLGIQQINVGSVAVKNPQQMQEWIEKFGYEKIILSADVKNTNVTISGWQLTSTVSVFDLISEYEKLNIKYVTCTDVGRDGMLEGPNFELYKKLRTQFPHIHLIASGGVRSMDDIRQLKSIGLYGVIIGKALYEGSIAPDQLMIKHFNK
jgi:phosphoribosylformimino-5-aminoimidazole carboxamide ribotide isomerase